MKLSGDQAQPSITALWDTAPLADLTITFAVPFFDEKVIDTTGYDALQFYVNGSSTTGPWAQVSLEWLNDLGYTVNTESYDLGFDAVAIDTPAAAFRIPVKGQAVNVNLGALPTPGADLGTLRCIVYGTNASGYGCDTGDGTGGVLVNDSDNIVGAGTVLNPMPFYYGPASLNIAANDLLNGQAFLDYEFPLGSNTWFQFAVVRPNRNPVQPVRIPARHVRMRRVNFEAGAQVILANVIAPPTIGAEA